MCRCIFNAISDPFKEKIMGASDRENHGEIDPLFDTSKRLDDNEKPESEKCPQPPDPVVKWTQLTLPGVLG